MTAALVSVARMPGEPWWSVNARLLAACLAVRPVGAVVRLVAGVPRVVLLGGEGPPVRAAVAPDPDPDGLVAALAAEAGDLEPESQADSGLRLLVWSLASPAPAAAPPSPAPEAGERGRPLLGLRVRGGRLERDPADWPPVADVLDGEAAGLDVPQILALLARRHAAWLRSRWTSPRHRHAGVVRICDHRAEYEAIP